MNGNEEQTFSFCTIIVTYVHLYKVMNENVICSMVFFIEFSFISQKPENKTSFAEKNVFELGRRL